MQTVYRLQTKSANSRHLEQVALALSLELTIALLVCRGQLASLVLELLQLLQLRLTSKQKQQEQQQQNKRVKNKLNNRKKLKGNARTRPNCGSGCVGRERRRASRWPRDSWRTSGPP